MIGKLQDNEIEQVLHQQVLGRLGCHADETTYIVPISYAYDGEFIYVHTQEGRKIDMMRKNPKVCFQTDIMKNMANWKTVIAWGEYEELKSEQQRRHALQYLIDRILPIISSETTHLSPQWPFAPEDMNEIKGIVFRIRLQNKSGRFERNEVHELFPYA